MKITSYQRCILVFSLLAGCCGMPGITRQACAKQEVYEETHRPQSFWFFGKPAKDNPTEQLSYARKRQRAGHLRSAARQYERLVNFWPDAPEAPSAQLEYAQIMDERGKQQDAFEGYKILLQRYPNYMPYDKILERMFQIAVNTMNHRKGKFLFFPGFKSPTRAVPLLEQIIELAPEWEKAPETQYLIGQAYDADKDYEMAIVAYTAVLYRYPSSRYAEKAAFQKAYNLFLLSQESPNDGTRAMEAWAALTFFQNNFPLSDHISDVRIYRDTIYTNRARAAFEEAQFYDKTARKPKAAIMAYRRFLQEFPHSGWTDQAENRIQALQQITEQDNP
jgi:outer membrane protein assembly factor BamD